MRCKRAVRPYFWGDSPFPIAEQSHSEAASDYEVRNGTGRAEISEKIYSHGNGVYLRITTSCYGFKCCWREELSFKLHF